MSGTPESDEEKRRKEREQETKERDSAERNTEKRKRYISALASLIKDIRRERREQNKTEHKKLPLEWIAAIAAVLAAVLSLGSLVAFIFLTLKTDHTAQTAINVSNAQLAEMKAEHRAWVGIYGATAMSPLIRRNDGKLALKFQLHFLNTGPSPARYVLEVADMIVRGPSATELSLARQDCEKLRDRSLGKDAAGITLFPNQPFDQPYIVSLPKPDEDRLSPLAPNGTTIMVAGCIDYVLAATNKHHQTAFVYELDEAGPGGAVWTIDPARIPIDASKLLMEINPGLADNAD